MSILLNFNLKPTLQNRSQLLHFTVRAKVGAGSESTFVLVQGAE